MTCQSAGLRAGPASRVLRGLAVAAAVPALAAAAVAPSAGPGGPGVGGKFGLSPAPDSQGRQSSYVSLSVAAGRSATATVIVANLAGNTQRLLLGRSVGVTATNGGSAYSPLTRGCAGAGCWVTGLPPLVTLPGRTEERLNFIVRVPAGTAPGQYLSGITARPDTSPRSVRLGSNGRRSARAVILGQVTVGVAVTVGRLPALTTRLRIPGVLAAIEGPVARLNIRLLNTGQTFAHGTGKASCTAGGRRHSYAVYADTVLPHDHALIAVNAPGLPEGAALPCRVWLLYGRHQVASWSGTVTIAAAQSSRIARTGNGDYSVIPTGGGIPVWAITLMVIGGLILAGLGVLLIRLR